MKWFPVLALVLVGCSGPVDPPQLGREPVWTPWAGPAADAGETPRQDASEPEAASLVLDDASAAGLSREGNVSCFGQIGPSQLEWSYAEGNSSASLLMQESDSTNVMMGQAVTCALMTTLDADQCAATATDSSTLTTWTVSYNPTTNTFAGARYTGMVVDGGRIVTTTQDFAGTCLGSWGDL